jgi:hypothetical protein
VFGTANNGSGAAGVYGQSSTGSGVTGYSTASGSSVHAIFGQAVGTDAIGVHGVSNNGSSAAGVKGGSASGYGVYGESSAVGGIGVFGTSPGSGVYGYSASGDGTGVTGYSNGVANAHAVYGLATGTAAIGVHGVSTVGYDGTGVKGEGYNYGVYGTSTYGYGLYGIGAYGVYGRGTGSISAGVYGYNPISYGVRGVSNDYYGVAGSSEHNSGVSGVTSADNEDAAGVVGYSMVNSSSGVYGIGGLWQGQTNGIGVRGLSYYGYAGYFDGKVHVNGLLTASTKSFKIDHPLDPKNKYLYHTSVESPDMMDIYNGNVTTDGKGEATVTMPDYFEALNRDFRYQLTVIGSQFAQAIVSSEIKDNRFSIKTDKPNIKVSWQVTGIRHDRYADAHRSPVEEDKVGDEKGKYLDPASWGQPESKGLFYSPRQAQNQAPRPQGHGTTP